MVKTFCAVQSGPGHRGIFFIISMPVCCSDIRGQSCISWWTEKFGQINHVTLSVYFFVCVSDTRQLVSFCVVFCALLAHSCRSRCVCVCVFYLCVCVCVFYLCVCVCISLCFVCV